MQSILLASSDPLTVANKVARVTALFWLMKIVATTLGETLGDFLAMTLDLGYAVGILVTASFFLPARYLQLRSPTYEPLAF